MEKRLNRSKSAAHEFMCSIIEPKSAFSLHIKNKWYCIAPEKMQNCQNPLKVESKMTEEAKIFNIRPLYLWNGNS